LNHSSLDAILFDYLIAEIDGGCGAGDVVDGDVAAFGGEEAG
jgi:hypothetical protein